MKALLMYLAPALLATSLSVGRASAADAFHDAQLKSLMQTIETRADTFEHKLEQALDHSSANGSDLEDQMNRFADILEDSVDDMAENFDEGHSARFIDKLENALIAGSAVDRVMLRRDLGGAAEAEWRALRSDLNTVAAAFHRPVLPNITVTTITPTATLAVISKPEVTLVMDRIEDGTDRFEHKLKEAIQHSTANMTDREPMFNRWAGALESSTDKMAEEYKEKDFRDFANELQNTLAIASAINRMMLRSDLSPEANAEWASVRNDLNTLATAFGHAVLPNAVVHVRSAAKK